MQNLFIRQSWSKPFKGKSNDYRKGNLREKLKVELSRVHLKWDGSATSLREDKTI